MKIQGLMATVVQLPLLLISTAESSAGPDHTTMKPHPITTGPPSSVTHTMENLVAFILDVPFEQYVSHELQLIEYLKDVLENGEVEVKEATASAYGSSQ